MKKVSVILSICFAGIIIALFVRMGMEQPLVHNRFVILENYTFEVLSNPDKDSNIKVKITNTEKKGFDYYENFNDAEALRMWTLNTMDSPVFIPFKESDYPTERIVEIHAKSGLSIMTQPFSKESEPIKVFESASNFFNIY